MKSRLLRVVVASEDAGERQILTQVVEGLPGTALVAEVTLICQMGRQAGHVAADCVVLDIDRYPLAGALSLTQARATFRGASVIVLARSIRLRFLHFLEASGASCCIDKDDPGWQVQLMQALRAIATSGGGTPLAVQSQNPAVAWACPGGSVRSG
ncbi:MAG TPA: hypothetical protein DEP84_20240 [Chloroflexi bacterium]|nr:hypothetical protein [Chloroflexota bacterium]